VVQKDQPTQEDIDELHDRVMKTLKAMFDTHKVLMPDLASKELTIL
jgi:Diacylglycerol acyltransferase